MGEGDGLTVAQAAEELGTSPQTVRALLRKGELDGRQRPWGSRYVWEVSRPGLDEFLDRYGRLDGHRRQPRTTPAPAAGALDSLLAERPPAPRPFLLRPRGRATLVVVVAGLPLLVVWAGVRLLPDVWWFQEVGQADVLRRVLTAKLEVHLVVTAVAALFVGCHLAVALRRTGVARSGAGLLALVGTSLLTGSIFGSAARGHWQEFLLWGHRQPFGLDDPIHGRDVGFFVFSLPLELLVAGWLLSLVALTTGYVVAVDWFRGTLGFRPVRAGPGVQVHLAVLGATFLLVVAWRLSLERYLLELGQPSTREPNSFAGAGFVDVQVRLPWLTFLTVATVVLAAVVLSAPLVARAGRRRTTRLVVLSGALLGGAAALVGAVLPAVVQRFVVDPNPLLSEQPYLEDSLAATRTGLGLDAIEVEPYTPTGSFSAADFPSMSRRLENVAEWDAFVLEARMRQLVTDRPFYRPPEPVLDVPPDEGRRRPTLVSARQLDVSEIPGAGTWVNDRLAYTHGLGLIRFSGTEIGAARQPRLLDSGLEVEEPRIYFGDLPPPSVAEDDEEQPAVLSATTDAGLADSPWVLVATRRPEVDFPGAEAPREGAYSYDGPAGIEVSGWVRRAVLGAVLGSKELLLSEDVTSQSRLLLHRDVHDRLHALAPFLRWDQDAVPLTANGRIVFVVEGYTTSDWFPYAQQVELAGVPTSYARASVRATVDAFTGEVDLYLTDDADPIARAWSGIFPSLFSPEDEMPAELRSRLRYPRELFEAQATGYERFHVTRPDVFVSDAEAWARPLALSGPIEVAGDIDFDESDEDDLRLTLPPSYKFAPPPGGMSPRLIVETYYTPRAGQNLVASLSGWVDAQGRPRLTSRVLPRTPVTLGPAQMSRLAFASTRVRNLLGIRNLEIRDLAASSLDTVLLGRPRLLFFPGGVLQLQSLYEGSRGPGAARLIGVTAFLDGRVGLGVDIETAVRQALNEPPQVDVVRVAAPVVVGRPVELTFEVANGRRAFVTVRSPGGRHHATVKIRNGTGSVDWTPDAAGTARVHVEVAGLDGTSVTDAAELLVLEPRPRIRLPDPPRRAVVGRPVDVPFEVTDGERASVRVSTSAGVVFHRDFLLPRGRGVATWTPQRAGRALVVIRARGPGGRTTTESLRLVVVRRPPEVPPPRVDLLRVPDDLTVGTPAELALRAEDCASAVAKIDSDETEGRVWRFPCPTRRGTFVWRPVEPGRYLLTVTARGDGTAAQVTTRLRVRGRR
ncbi:UPF0182 family protein [Nocardioides sp. GXQ0305]|uniref:UPF0182 family protein n=1 Tax=Nocardioides sp. GXQ0305 TaxID=3423912 RepID=UPI003D7EAC51